MYTNDYYAAYLWKYECAKIKKRKQTLLIKPQNFDAVDIKCLL